MSIYSIYRITNLITNKVYIGYTKNPKQRWRDHQNDSKNEKSLHYEKVLYHSIRKHSIENFIFEVIYQSRDQDYTKNVMENYFISEYNSHVDFPNTNGYNMTLGGDGVTGHSIETKAKIGAAGKGRIPTDATRQKLKMQRKANAMVLIITLREPSR